MDVDIEPTTPTTASRSARPSPGPVAKARAKMLVQTDLDWDKFIRLYVERVTATRRRRSDSRTAAHPRAHAHRRIDMTVVESYAVGRGDVRDHDVLLGLVGQHAEAGEQGVAVRAVLLGLRHRRAAVRPGPGLHAGQHRHRRAAASSPTWPRRRAERCCRRSSAASSSTSPTSSWSPPSTSPAWPSPFRSASAWRSCSA